MVNKITQDIEAKRFELRLNNDDVAFVEYQLAGNNMIFHHTEVPVGYEGQGIGTQLAQYVMDYAQEHGHKVQALCPFINHFVSEHPEYHAITWGY